MGANDNLLKGIPGNPALQGNFIITDTDQSTALFTVAKASGNTTIAGTLGVTGVITATGGVARTGRKRLYNARAKVGTGAGWVLSAANNVATLATMAASQTAGTLVVFLDDLIVGDTITGFHLIGQIESAGGIATLDASLRSQQAVAADPTDAEEIAAMTQLSVTADTAVTAANSSKTGSAVIAADKTYYLLVTGTTAASTDIQLLAVALTTTEA